MRQNFHDRVSLEIARDIVRELPTRPEWIDLARGNLARWRRANHDAPGLLRCYEEWEALLQQPIEAICRALLEQSPDGERRRHNSPFAGALPPRVIWDIKRRVRDETVAA